MFVGASDKITFWMRANVEGEQIKRQVRPVVEFDHSLVQVDVLDLSLNEPCPGKLSEWSQIDMHVIKAVVTCYESGHGT